MSDSKRYLGKSCVAEVFFCSGTIPRIILVGGPGMIGGGSLGQTNNCQNNGRLVYDSQGKIGCTNPLNQGGQHFVYPRKITTKVGGRKRTSKKKNERG